MLAAPFFNSPKRVPKEPKVPFIKKLRGKTLEKMYERNP